MLTFLLLGFAAGAITGVPIGPVNVAVIDAAYRHTVRRAIAVGLGGACGDALYAGLGVLGVTPVLQSHAAVPPILYGVSGVVLMIYGFITARSQPGKQAKPEDGAPPVAGNHELWQGFRVGLLLIVLNPAAVVTWVVIMGSVFSAVSTLEGVLCSLGVFLGSFGWFCMVAFLTHKGKNVLGDKAQWIPRIVGIALMFYAVYLIAKAVHYVVA